MNEKELNKIINRVLNNFNNINKEPVVFRGSDLLIFEVCKKYLTIESDGKNGSIVKINITKALEELNKEELK